MLGKNIPGREISRLQSCPPPPMNSLKGIRGSGQTVTELPRGGEASQKVGAPHARPWGTERGEAPRAPSFPPCLLPKVACPWEARPFLLGLEEAEGRQGWPGQQAGSERARRPGW